MSWLDEVKWDQQGLAPAVTQDFASQRLLTLAWMNREALEATVTESRAVYWSRSRGKLWRKGEQSGHIQRLIELRLDCDSDAILLLVEQIGGIACHTGRESCFFKVYKDGDWIDHDPIIKEPKEIYSDKLND